MESKTKEAVKKNTGRAVLGLNAAAIIWLYSAFVPKADLHRAEQRIQQLEQKLEVAGETIAVLRNLHSRTYE